MNKPWYQMTLEERFKDTIERYKCDCKNADHHGCTDCLNTGYCFDTQEISLIEDLHDELRKEKDEKIIFFLFGALASYVLTMIFCKIIFL